MPRKLYLSRSASFIFLFLLFTFDAVVSYWGVVYKEGREVNLLIAYLVEKYPPLYFVTIPLLIIFAIVFTQIVTRMASYFIKKVNIGTLNRIINTALVLYWFVGNSSTNLIFLAGYRVPNLWFVTTLIAIPLTLLYTYTAITTYKKSI